MRGSHENKSFVFARQYAFGAPRCEVAEQNLLVLTNMAAV
jgi:hypothetical protein